MCIILFLRSVHRGGEIGGPLRPLIRLWRGRGLKAIIYLDDGTVAVRGNDRAINESVIVKSDLENAGFVINVEKKA